MRCLMIDVAQTSMAAGAACAIAQVTGVNDNMSQSHYHDYFELYFLDSGERYHLMDDKLFKLQAGDCILFPPQTMHRSYGDQDIAFSRAVLYFRPETITSAELLHKLLHSQVVYRPDSQELHQLRRIIYAMEEEQNSHLDCHDECMQSLLNLIMVQLLRMNQESTGILRETRVTKVIQYIHNHYAEDITLKDLSERFYVSEYYLCREFKKSTKRTIVEYIKQTRMLHRPSTGNAVRSCTADVSPSRGLGFPLIFHKYTKTGRQRNFSLPPRFYNVISLFANLLFSEYWLISS